MPVFLVHTFNVTSVSSFVKYMIISNIHRTPKNGILFTDVCTKYFFNRQDFMNHSVEVCFAILVNLFRSNEDLIRIINCELSQVRPPNASSRSAREVPSASIYCIVYNV